MACFHLLIFYGNLLEWRLLSESSDILQMFFILLEDDYLLAIFDCFKSLELGKFVFYMPYNVIGCLLITTWKNYFTHNLQKHSQWTNSVMHCTRFSIKLPHSVHLAKPILAALLIKSVVEVAVCSVAQIQLSSEIRCSGGRKSYLFC